MIIQLLILQSGDNNIIAQPHTHLHLAHYPHGTMRTDTLSVSPHICDGDATPLLIVERSEWAVVGPCVCAGVGCVAL